jgi:hypothetical protein
VKCGERVLHITRGGEFVQATDELPVTSCPKVSISSPSLPALSPPPMTDASESEGATDTRGSLAFLDSTQFSLGHLSLSNASTVRSAGRGRDLLRGFRRRVLSDCHDGAVTGRRWLHSETGLRFQASSWKAQGSLCLCGKALTLGSFIITNTFTGVNGDTANKQGSHQISQLSSHFLNCLNCFI